MGPGLCPQLASRAAGMALVAQAKERPAPPQDGTGGFMQNSWPSLVSGDCIHPAGGEGAVRLLGVPSDPAAPSSCVCPSRNSFLGLMAHTVAWGFIPG